MSVVLRGRDHQIAVLEELLTRARSGRGGALSFLAEPGMGKTALLECAVRRAGADFRTLGIRGIRQESSLELAGLHRLLGPLADRIECLPACQAEALTRVFDGNGAVDPYTLCTAVHALLTGTSHSGPVLCWLDDVHWLDRASLDAMTFTARRLGDRPVVMLFAAHNEHVTTPERDRLAGIPRLPLPPLDETASTEVLTDRCPIGVTEDLAAGLTELTGGNPLALVEMAAALTPGQLSGDEPPPETLPPESQLRAVYRRRFFRLSPDARRLALLAVADDRLDGRTLTRAALADRLDLRELEAVRAWGLVRVDGESITVPSPVIRSALYADAPLSERNTVHELLARVLDDDRQRARQVWHRAALACEANDGLAAELCEAAAEAGAAGRYTDSSRAWQRAATLTRDRGEQATMLLAAATDAWLAGRSRRSRFLVRQLTPAARQGRLRGRADLLRGEIELRDGRPATGARMLLDAAARLADHDRRSAVVALAYAGEASCLGGDLRRYLAIAERAAVLRRRHEAPDTELLFAHFEGMAATYQGHHHEAAEPLRRTVRLADATDDCASKVWASMAALILGDDRRTHELAGEAVRLGTGPDAAVKPWALAYLAMADLWLGRYPSATAHSLEGLRLARAAGQENHAVDHLATMALLAALQGDKDTARLRLDAVSDAATRRGLARPGAFTSWALACLELIEDRPADAAGRIRLMAGTWHAHPVVHVMATPHFVEAAVRCDERKGALQALEVFDRWATSTRNSVRLALSHRCHALLAGDDAEADEHFREALRLHLRGDSAFETARTELLYGHRLRRGRKPRAAREHLRNALQIFEYYDAEHWTGSARAELRAAGETAPPMAPKDAGELTNQQRQIARLAAEGATNREIAARLVLSHRTVDHHLRNVFVRLGIRSRVELPRFFS
ncbi:AAA family ATPase [Actinoallomurus bryophytorum]|uniref:AAA family ATPase n=1 Tax=Actinoallomurus bryophytorum TaxID=1490222 RepID=UPI0011525450|nr:LuxR family transcriptional regulator [Actinoallomurus bryophytorum]